MSDLLVFTTGHDTDLLAKSVARVSLTLQVYNENPWVGYTTGKIAAAIRFLQNRTEKLCMFLDGSDTLLLQGEEEVFARYNASGAEVIIATESTCWPDPELMPLYDRVNHPHAVPNRYINAGGWIGERKVLMTALHTVLRYNADMAAGQEDDQRAWTGAFLSGMMPMLQLDYSRQFFSSMGDGIKAYAQGERSCSMHWNGKTPGRYAYWQMLEVTPYE